MCTAVSPEEAPIAAEVGSVQPCETPHETNAAAEDEPLVALGSELALLQGPMRRQEEMVIEQLSNRPPPGQKSPRTKQQAGRCLRKSRRPSLTRKEGRNYCPSESKGQLHCGMELWSGHYITLYLFSSHFIQSMARWALKQLGLSALPQGPLVHHGQQL